MKSEKMMLKSKVLRANQDFSVSNSSMCTQNQNPSTMVKIIWCLSKCLLLSKINLIIFPNYPLFYVSTDVFGCNYFVHICPSLDKPSAKTIIKCVFLGYSHLQKGGKC